MALFKVLRGNSTALASQPLHDGYAYFTPDDGRFFIDVQLDTAPTLAHASGVVGGKNVYRIELEATIWDSILDQLDINSPHLHAHKDLILKGGTTSFTYDGTAELQLDLRADWNETNQNSISFIKNKPTIINVGITMNDNTKTMYITTPVTSGDGVNY